MLPACASHISFESDRQCQASWASTIATKVKTLQSLQTITFPIRNLLTAREITQDFPEDDAFWEDTKDPAGSFTALQEHLSSLH